MPGPSPTLLDLGPGVAGAFTARPGGTSAPPYDELDLALHVGDEPARVLHNRELLARALGTDAARTTWCEQVHGAAVTTVTAADAGRGAHDVADALPGADALVTSERGVPLAVLTADCVPVLLADSGAGVVGAVHAGWRGLAGGVVENAVEAMRRAGATDVTAVIGPAIGPCCYEVGADVYDRVTSVRPGTRATTPDGRPALDLRAGARDAVVAAGVVRTAVVGGCTAHAPRRYFSHRRDGVTGRQAAVVWLR